MLPLIIQSHFEHYQVLSQWQAAVSCGERVTSHDDSLLFSIITRELTIAADEWCGVLMRLGVSIPPNFFHAHSIYHELVQLLQRGELRLVKIPRLERLPAIAAEKGWGYCFTRGPDRHPSLSYSPVNIDSLQAASTFLDVLNMSEHDISRLLPLTRVVTRADLAELLANHSILAYKIPVTTAAPAPKPVEYLPATAADRPVPLAPETKKSTPALNPEKQATPKAPPKTIEESAQRLIDAGPAVRAAKANNKPLPPSSYSLADKQAVIESGTTERFMVRVIPAGHAGDEGYVAQKREHGGTIAWMAPLSMVEHGDTDAEALLKAFGTRHDPGTTYTVLIIDTHKMNELADVKTIIPTNANLQKLMADNPQITKVKPEITKQVLNEDFAPKYYKFAKGMSKAGTVQKDVKEMEGFAQSQGFSKEETDSLIARHQLARDVSAWEEFTGNGMTLDTNTEGKTAYGPVELVMLDKSPKTLGELKQQNAILSLPAN